MGIREPLRAAAAALLIALAGCASTFDLEAPTLSVVSMKVQSADIFSQRMQIRMRVQNPNARELPIKGITYRIEVSDAELGHGSADTAGEHEGGEHRAEFASHGESNDAAHDAFEAELIELIIYLRGKNGARESAGDDDLQL